MEDMEMKYRDSRYWRKVWGIQIMIVIFVAGITFYAKPAVQDEPLPKMKYGFIDRACPEIRRSCPYKAGTGFLPL